MPANAAATAQVRRTGDAAVFLTGSSRSTGTRQLEHRPEKWEPVFRLKGCDNKELERAPCVRFSAARSKR